MELPNSSRHLPRHGKSTLANSAYLSLRESIISNEFKPGEILSENMLADLLKMSRTPIRDALKELKSDDLVQLIPGTGIIVKELSEKELRDLFSVRLALESLAVETAIGYFDAAELESLLAEWGQLRDAAKNAADVDWKKIARLDARMHMMLVNKSHNECLMQLYEAILPKLIRYQSLTAQSWGRAANTAEQHIEILQALQEKDAEKIHDLLDQHLKSGLEIILKKI